MVHLIMWHNHRIGGYLLMNNKGLWLNLLWGGVVVVMSHITGMQIATNDTVLHHRIFTWLWLHCHPPCQPHYQLGKKYPLNEWSIIGNKTPRGRFELPRHEDSGFRIHRDTGLCDLGLHQSEFIFPNKFGVIKSVFGRWPQSSGEGLGHSSLKNNLAKLVLCPSSYKHHFITSLRFISLKQST